MQGPTCRLCEGLRGGASRFAVVSLAALSADGGGVPDGAVVPWVTWSALGLRRQAGLRAVAALGADAPLVPHPPGAEEPCRTQHALTHCFVLCVSFS